MAWTLVGATSLNVTIAVESWLDVSEASDCELRICDCFPLARFCAMFSRRVSGWTANISHNELKTNAEEVLILFTIFGSVASNSDSLQNSSLPTVNHVLFEQTIQLRYSSKQSKEKNRAGIMSLGSTSRRISTWKRASSDSPHVQELPITSMRFGEGVLGGRMDVFRFACRLDMAMATFLARIYSSFIPSLEKRTFRGSSELRRMLVGGTGRSIRCCGGQLVATIAGKLFKCWEFVADINNRKFRIRPARILRPIKIICNHNHHVIQNIHLLLDSAL
jgi:hypothetical protein